MSIASDASERIHVTAGRVLTAAEEATPPRRRLADVASQALVRSMVEEAPLRTLTMGGVTQAELDALVDLLNGRWVAGGRRVLAEVLRRLRRAAR